MSSVLIERIHEEPVGQRRLDDRRLAIGRGSGRFGLGKGCPEVLAMVVVAQHQVQRNARFADRPVEFLDQLVVAGQAFQEGQVAADDDAGRPRIEVEDLPHRLGESFRRLGRFVVAIFAMRPMCVSEMKTQRLGSVFRSAANIAAQQNSGPGGQRAGQE